MPRKLNFALFFFYLTHTPLPLLASRFLLQLLRFRHSLFPQSTQVKAAAAELQTGQVSGNPSALVYPQCEHT